MHYKNKKLYKRGYMMPWLRCVMELEGENIKKEAHKGEAGAHEGERALTDKVLRMGLYRPTMYKEA